MKISNNTKISNNERRQFSTIRRCNTCGYETFVLSDIPQTYRCKRCNEGLMRIIAVSLGNDKLIAERGL